MLTIELLAVCKSVESDPATGVTSVIGICDRILVAEFPVELDSIRVAVRLRDFLQDKWGIEYGITDADGKAIHPREVKFHDVAYLSELSAAPVEMIEFIGVHFQRAGEYSVWFQASAADLEPQRACVPLYVDLKGTSIFKTAGAS